MRTIRIAAAVAGLASLTVVACMPSPPLGTADPAVVAKFATQRCPEATAEMLAGAGIVAGDIQNVTYQELEGGGRDQDRVTKLQSWVTLVGQPGYVVAETTPQCRPIQIYARDGARLPVG